MYINCDVNQHLGVCRFEVDPILILRVVCRLQFVQLVFKYTYFVSVRFANNPGSMTTPSTMTSQTARQLDSAVDREDRDAFHQIITNVNPAEGQDLFLLHRACAFGLPITLHDLLQRGFYDVDARDCKGCTPLHVAVSTSNCDAVVLLLDAGANVQYGNDDGTTALHMICSRELRNQTRRQWCGFVRMWQSESMKETARRSDVIIIRLLLGANADDLAVNNLGWTPAEVARSSPNQGVRECMQAIADERVLQRRVAMLLSMQSRVGSASAMRVLNDELLLLVSKCGIGRS